MDQSETQLETSARGLRWRIPESHGASAKRLKAENDLVKTIVAQRFDDPKKAEEFLSPLSYDAFVKELFPQIAGMKDFEASAERLADAIEKGETIGISGDYDCDGNCSVALLCRLLMESGVPAQKILPHIPNRIAEGYGVNELAVEAMNAQKVDLLLTLDNGTLAFDALKSAHEKGMDVIVADHHPNEEGQAPPVGAKVINPNRYDDTLKQEALEGKGLEDVAAVGVTFFLALRTQQILKERGYYNNKPKTPNPENWLGLVALATIGDVVNIGTPINRTLVKEGLRVIAEERDPIIKTLCEVAQQPFPPNSETIAFQLAPIINAPGRLGQSVAWAFLSDFASKDTPFKSGLVQDIQREIDELDHDIVKFHAPTPKSLDSLPANHNALSQEAYRLMLLSREANTKRKALEGELRKRATRQAEVQMSEHPERGTLIVGGEDWHPGLIGIVAGRLKERYTMPVIAASFDAETGLAKCSARSVKVEGHEVDMGKAFRELKEEGVLLKAGGHPMAAGATFKTKDLETFRERFDAKLGEAAKAAKTDYREEVNIVLELRSLRDAKGSLEHGVKEWLSKLAALEPFGEGNPKPRIVLKDIFTEGIRTSRDGKHLFCSIQQRDMLDTISLEGRAFHAGNTPLHEGLRSAENPVSIPGKRTQYAHALGTLSYGTDQRGKDVAGFMVEDIYAPRAQVKGLAPSSYAKAVTEKSGAIPCLEGSISQSKHV